MWLPNTRGSTYSRRHVSKNPSDTDFWDFSFSEIGLFDLPATIDYVREKTGHSEIFFVGHSQGTTSLLTLLSEKPEYNNYIAAASLLAPVAYLGNSGPVLQSLAQITPLLVMYNEKLSNWELQL